MSVFKHCDETLFLLQCIMLNAGVSSQKPGKSRNTPPSSSASDRLKKIHIDEEVKIAVNLSLERFRYSDQRGINCYFYFYFILTYFFVILFLISALSFPLLNRDGISVFVVQF